MLVGDRHDVVFMDCDECVEQRQFNQVEATVTELAVLRFCSTFEMTPKLTISNSHSRFSETLVR